MRFHLMDATRALSMAAILGLATATFAIAQETTEPEQGTADVAQETTVVGDWKGTIDPEGQAIDVIFHVTADDDGTLSALLDVPTQGSFGIPLEDVALVDDVFTFGLSAVPGGASFEAALSEDGSSMEGTWTQGPKTAKLTMTRSEG